MKFSYMKNLNLCGDNILMSVFAVLSLKMDLMYLITDKQFLHFQRELLKPAK